MRAHFFASLAAPPHVTFQQTSGPWFMPLSSADVDLVVETSSDVIAEHFDPNISWMAYEMSGIRSSFLIADIGGWNKNSRHKILCAN
jgi:hypothetical protein